MTQTPAADIVERVVMHTGICGHHHDDNCQSCRSARECTDAEIDRLHAEIEALRRKLDEVVKALEWIRMGDTEVFDDDMECLVTVSATSEEMSKIAEGAIISICGRVG